LEETEYPEEKTTDLWQVTDELSKMTRWYKNILQTQNYVHVVNNNVKIVVTMEM
jgi:hypothetical protein